MIDQDEPRSEPGHETPEGYTKEEPAAEELGEPGTPGAGMTPDAPHAADADAIEHGDVPAHTDGEPASTVAHHDATTHMDDHTALSDDHGHAEPVLGPVDWAKWGYALVGAAAAVIVVALFWMATS